MALTAAVQMDPLETIGIAGDSSFALMLSAQARGHRLFHYDAADLSWSGGRLRAAARPVTVQRVTGDHVRFGDPVTIDLGADVDVVLMRQDPPFDLGYITATHLLERIAGETLVVNDPVAVRNAPEKLFVLDYARFMPPTLVTRSLAEARAFLADHGAIVVKPLHGNGGKAIFRIGANGENLSALLEMFNQAWREPHMLQAFLPAVADGDKRIVLVDGEVAGAINRLPGAGEFRSNLAVGGSAEKTELTAREREICAALGPELKRRGLVFVGIDVIGGQWLTEINVTSPTGIVAIERFDGTDVAGLIWDAIERARRTMSDWIVRLIEQTGYVGVAFLMFLETVFPPIPSEVIMPVAGLQAAQGKLSLPLVVASGTAGAMVGNYLWYLAARVIGIDRFHPFIDRWGRWLTIDWHEIERAQKLFGHYGSAFVFIARMLPTVRSLISIPAGFLKMRLLTFVFWSTLGTAIWTGVLTGAGYWLGRQFENRIDDFVGPISNAVIGLILLTYVWRLIFWRPSPRDEPST